MAEAQGSTVSFRYKKEAVSNIEETGSGGQILRRVTGQLDLVKSEVLSQEKRTDFQEVEQVHGTRSVNWAINSEIFAGDYKDFIAAAVRQDFAPVTDITGSNYGIASGVLTSDGNDFLTSGLRQGMVIRLSGMTESSVNSRNMRVTGVVTDGSAAISPVDGGADLVDSASAAATITVPGQHTYIPLSEHTKDTFTIERHDTETGTSDIGWGNKVGVMDLNIQPDQPTGLSFSGIGIDRRSLPAGDAPSLTSPASSGTGPLISAALGVLRLNDAVVGIVTGATMQLNTGLQNRSVAFANASPNVYYGRAAQVTGTINVMKQGIALAGLFDNETEFSVEILAEAPGSDPKAFFSIFLPRVKLNSADDDDPDGPIVQTLNFRSLRPRSGTGLYLSSFMIQDSQIS